MRVELGGLVLPAPGKQPAAATRRIFALSYDLWEERFAVTTVEARSQSVSHLALTAAEAWCVEQLTIPLAALGALGRDQPFWIRLEYRILDGDGAPDESDSGYTLQALIDVAEPPPEDRGVAERPRGRSVPDAGTTVLLATMTLRTRLIAAFLASTLLPLGATIWITTTLLDRSLQYATTGELDRLSRTLENTAKQFYQRERDALKQDALAGRAPATMYPASNESQWPESVRAFWESGEPERFGVSGASGERVDYMRRVEGPGGRSGVEVYSRDLGGVSMAQLSSQVRETRRLVEHDRDARSAAWVHADAAGAAGCGVARLAAAADTDRPSRQPTDPAAHRSAYRFRRRRLVAKAGDWRAARCPTTRRSRPRCRSIQPHGGSTRGEP